MSRVMCNLAQKIPSWVEHFSVFLTAKYIPGKNSLADQLSWQDQVILTQWFLLLRVFDTLCEEYSCLHIELFTTRASPRLLLYMCPIADPLAWKSDALATQLGQSKHLCLPSICFLRQVILRVTVSWNLTMILVTPLCPQTDGLQTGSSGGEIS